MYSDYLVTAIMPTHDRDEFVPMAIEYFHRQTYPHRELLVLDDTPRRQSPPTWALGYPWVRYAPLDTVERIGRKRNIACSRAQGSIIMHWDDDDYSAPDRMADQVERLIESGKQVTGYHSMRFTDGRSWWMYRGGPGRAIGTSLCYWREFWESNPFPDVATGEDIAFVQRAQAHIVTVDAEGKMFARNHGKNTSPRVMTNTAMWEPVCA